MKTHQNVIINGIEYGDAEVRKGSKFCNEGKWENFIKPILPEGDTFIEYGSNAGMYLKLAREKFRRVIGLERNHTDCEVAEKYRNSLGLDYEIINRQVDDISDLPIADVTLLANFHYHQHINEFRKLLNQLESKTIYALVVSVREPQKHWRAQADPESVKRYFRHWTLVDEVEGVSGDDPHPRDMFSMLFKSPKLEVGEVKVNEENREWRYLREFVRACLKGEDVKGNYYGVQMRRRKGKWSQEEIDRFIEEKQELILDVAKEGLKSPLIVDDEDNLLDGLHRYAVLRELGIKPIRRVM